MEGEKKVGRKHAMRRVEKEEEDVGKEGESRGGEKGKILHIYLSYLSPAGVMG